MEPGRELDKLVAETIGQKGMIALPYSADITAAWDAWEWLELNNPWRPVETDPGDISLSRYWLNTKPAVIVIMVDGAEIVDYRPGLPPSTRYNFAIWGESYPHAIALAVLATREEA